ncbi:MAG: class I lanthipeptide [Bacteroidota bacterium]
MKKKSLKSLSLRKKTISKLDEQAQIVGGVPPSFVCVTIATVAICVTQSYLFICCKGDKGATSVFPACDSNLGACPIR